MNRELYHSDTNVCCEQESAILVTNREKKITQEALDRVRVLVISRHLLAQIYKKAWEYVRQHEQNERGHWVAKWVRKPGTEVPALFLQRWTLMVVDEAHFLRNQETEWCVSHLSLIHI